MPLKTNDHLVLITPKLIGRFWKRVEQMEDGCWEWRGHLHHGAYGTLPATRIDGRPRAVQAHRTSYRIHFGEIPNGLFVCHKCDNMKCVRPDHLFLGTNLDNNRDRDAKGRGFHKKLAQRTHCPEGHEYSERNTLWQVKLGYRYRSCKKCRAAKQRVNRRKRLDRLKTIYPDSSEAAAPAITMTAAV